MIVANLSDGRTLHFDLTEEGDVKRWTEVQDDAQFQASITGIGILHSGRLQMLPLPKGFRRVAFSAELVADKSGTVIGERVTCQADDLAIVLLLYTGETPLARYTVNRVGWQRVGPGITRRLIAQGTDGGMEHVGNRTRDRLSARG